MVNEEAFKHMLKTPPRFWSKPYFWSHNKCDSVLNNMLEAFNSVILESRTRPLVTLLEEIKTYIMEKCESNRMRFQTLVDGNVLHNIRKKLERTCTYTNLWLVK